MTILIVDDDPDARSVLKRFMEDLGHEAREARDGQDGLDAALRERPNAIISDGLMPRMDGPRTLAAIQVLTPRIPCCFMTGHLGVYTEADLRTQGARAVFAKPFYVPEVAKVLRDIAGSVAAVRSGAMRSYGLTTTTQQA